MQILSRAAKKLAELHAAGYVHRNLKPSNVLFLEKESEWRFIGTKDIAKAGAMAPLTYSLRYAAPESVTADDLKLRDVPVHPAADAWALGVIAFELLVGSDSFEAHSDSQVRNLFCSCVSCTMLANLNASREGQKTVC